MNNNVSIFISDTNIEVAQKLIYAKWSERIADLTLSHDFFTPDDLEEIASHLLAYVKAARSRERRNDE